MAASVLWLCGMLAVLISCCIAPYSAAAAQTADHIQQAIDYVNARESQYDQELIDFASIPSISALPEHHADVEAAANWLSKRLKAAGAEVVEVLQTEGLPLVYGQVGSDPSRPTLLLYGHYDVQPAEPLELWDSPPFQPEIREGYFYGRGVDDDKGGILPAIQAVEALLATPGRLPINLKFLLEGEEEVGSPNLQALLEAHRGRFAADAAVSADSGQISATQPGLCLGLRGMVSLQVDLVSASSDMHSGMKGGSVVNPLHALADLISSLHHPNGSVAVEGFYDDVAPITDEEREDFAKYPFNEAEERESWGLLGFKGEQGFSILEQRWVRPTLEVVGMHGGFTGAGIKTIVPARGSAKISCRLVPNQRPEDILSKVERQLLQLAPEFVNLTVALMPGRASPFTSPKSLPVTAAAAHVLREVMGKEPVYYREGGSIGALTLLKDVLGLDTTGFGFCLGERIHAPNERLLRSFYHLGRTAWVKFLGGDKLAQLLGSCSSSGKH